MRILLIEDEIQVAQTLNELLGKYYVVEIAHTGREGEEQANSNEYDLIVVDFLLPDIDGIQVCKNLRHAGIITPILMLTGQSEVGNKVSALDAGADDYLTKPFNAAELLARIRALLRRQTILRSNILVVDTLSLDLAKNVVTRDGKIIFLRRKERYLLEYLMRNSGRVVTREMIVDHIWDSATESMTNIVDVHIKFLRDQIDKPFAKKLIKTIHGFGYKLEA